jgi:hypothetical protein
VRTLIYVDLGETINSSFLSRGWIEKTKRAKRMRAQIVGERANTLNQKLQRSSHAGRLSVARVIRAGTAPWVGNKAILRALYDHV